MLPHAESDALHARVQELIEAYVRGVAIAPTDFDALALSIARFQAERVPALGRLVRARGAFLVQAASADEIPAVPCDAFRLTRIAAHDAASDTRVFRTSGTTQGGAARGEHPMRTTATYERAALAFGEAMLFPGQTNMRCLVLAPRERDAPDSSLSFMIERFVERLGDRGDFHVRANGDVATIDDDGVARSAAEARREGEPVLVMGTSFAFVHLLDARGSRDLSLPAGSRVMQTGGFKGRSREVSAAALREALAEAFGAPLSDVVGEYGMTELSSQLYEGPRAIGLSSNDLPRYVAPPWMRVTAVSPTTLAPLPPGEVGLARIVDLANVDSAIAVQTSDRVRVTESGVELLGREKGATPRGCSLAMDDMLGAGPR